MGQGSQKESSSTQNKANKIKGLQQVTPAIAAHACNVVLLPHAVTKEGVTHDANISYYYSTCNCCSSCSTVVDVLGHVYAAQLI